MRNVWGLYEVNVNVSIKNQTFDITRDSPVPVLGISIKTKLEYSTRIRKKIVPIA